MAQFILPKTAHPDFSKPWQKPSGRVVIDESNPLAKHIVSAYINTPTGWHDICGRGPSYDPSTGLIPDNPAHEENEYRTYGFVLSPGTTGIVYEKTVETNGNRTIRVNITSSTNVQFLNGGNTGGWSNENFNVNVPGDKPFFLAASVTYVSGNEYKQVYCDRSHDLNTGNYADGFIDTTYDWDLPQGFELFVIWNRMFSEDEFHALNTNPYQIFRPAVDLGWYYSAGGGGSIAPQAYHHFHHNLR